MESPNKKSNILERKSTHWLVPAFLIGCTLAVLAEVLKIYPLRWIYYLCIVLSVVGITCAFMGLIYVFKERIRGDY